MVPVIVELSNNLNLPLRPLIWSLSLGACLGGNLTLVGASANLVTVGVAEHSGHGIRFLEFLKLGSGVVALTVTIATGYCLLVYVALGFGGNPPNPVVGTGGL